MEKLQWAVHFRAPPPPSPENHTDVASLQSWAADKNPEAAVLPAESKYPRCATLYSHGTDTKQRLKG